MRKKILLLLIPPLILTGCWSSNELNTIAINLAIGIDKVGNEYLVSCQIVNPSEVAGQKGGSGRTPVILLQGRGSNISEVMRKITALSPRKIHWAHIRMLIINEQVAKDGISKILDVLLRNTDVRPDFYIAISKNEKAQDILKILTPLDKIPANRIFSALEVSHKYWAPTVTVTIDDLTSKLMSEGIHPVITGIITIGKAKSGEKLENVQRIHQSASLKLTGNAVFNKDRLVGWLNTNQSKGYSYLTNNIHETIGTIRCSKNKKVVIEIERSRTKIASKVIDKRPVINVELSIKANIAEIQCDNINTNDLKVIHQLEKVSEKKITRLLRETLNVAQKKYKVDIFGFGESIHRTNPRYWHQVKNNWDEKFVNLPVNIKVDVEIENSSLSKNSFIDKMKK
ncbi:MULTISPECIES: Ger(x)C family spore germination protein [Bacillus cereus group]|uniref:Ger(x)C family spore germination protein n=1 Tax=Bacillus cereus group TaxID=86661 RepID=UPI000279E6A9|nr:Ger(x)C family spore germination protein [Bacillus cereus]EJR28583.1 Ger(X)C family germination protein [Bacillus cereus VD045]HDR4351017.1 Ger(x)C family spore germination protein [Bacillus cereus]HDR6957961.1 Ger(x)C family spore germination protein [Bacillus cereus]